MSGLQPDKGRSATQHDAKTGEAETLMCTPEHPLFVQGQGWVEARIQRNSTENDKVELKEI